VQRAVPRNEPYAFVEELAVSKLPPLVSPANAPTPPVWLRFGRLSRRRRTLLIEALLWLALARIALLTAPFARIARYLGAFVSPAEGRALIQSDRPSPAQAALAREIGWAVTRAAHHAPFEAVCLPQAMAAKLMLRRRSIPSALSFGTLGTPTDGLKCHAWLDAAGVHVTGYPVAKFTEIGCLI